MSLTRIQATILALLSMAGQPVHRTKLVKLAYLADNRFYELNSTTLTGLAYMWDSYGPNALGGAIVKEADALVSSSKVRMVVQPNIYDGDSYLYFVPEPVKESDLAPLSPGEIQVLRDTWQAFGRMTLRRIVAASKQTKPFKKAKQYEILHLQADAQALKLQKEVLGLSDFINATRRGLRDLKEGKLTSQEELDRLHKHKS